MKKLNRHFLFHVVFKPSLNSKKDKNTVLQSSIRSGRPELKRDSGREITAEEAHQRSAGQTGPHGLLKAQRQSDER